MSDKLSRTRSRTASKNIRDLLNDSRKRIDEAENIPAKLLRRVFLQCGVMPGQWEKAVDLYYNRMFPEDMRKAHQYKSNLLRALNSPKISWKRFNEALEVIGAKSYEFHMKCEFASGHTLKFKETLKNRRSNWVLEGGATDDNE